MNRAERRRQQKRAPKATPNTLNGALGVTSDKLVKSLIEQYRAISIEPPSEQTCQLTTTYVESNLEAIYRDLKMLRVETDAHFRALWADMKNSATPTDANLYWKLSQYPVNCCLEIVYFMMNLMMKKPVSDSAKGLLALRELHKKGGTFKVVWGALRGQYFQNAIQAGNHYIDVANDTVNPNKDNVEILPLHQSGFKNIDTFHEFSDIGEQYWKCRMVPNVFFPNLAPFLPIVTFFDNGVIRFDSLNNCMFPMNLESNLQLAQDFVFNNDRRKADLEAHWTKLDEVLAGKKNPPANHLLHFNTSRDDLKLMAAFDICTKARPSMLVQKIKAVINTQQSIWRPNAG
ncbi:hypothetical protein [Magnetovibrio blakemorei]|uniref:Uncharacterized protein n=1 Tax=Magnetovibrio blakemorei TaxID=28181 RepID=A0A1E5Q6H4_9PROT|nr:hypothetical protein [Magnetovibrio blakemorei]OEJ66213.1 hypothetical protein BEN30_12525 [Magnetovibrio blakemorei]